MKPGRLGIATLLMCFAFVAPAGVSSASQLSFNNIDTRITERSVSFNGLTFAGASQVGFTTIHFNGNIGDSGAFTVGGLAAGVTFLNFTSGTGVALSNTSFTGTQAQFTASIIGVQNTTVTWSQDLAAPAITTSSGFYELHYSGGGGNSFVKTGGVYTSDVLLPGNWSHQGTGIGQVEFLSINPAFSIVKDFVYDPQSHTTLFEAVSNSYPSSAPSVSLNFVLHGTAVGAVPEPESYALMLAGLGLIGLMARRRKSVK